ncbi:sugar transferase [Catalinimonas sp. 4WD22]|uniref:sugar transferase n=1 Tax=Catalinimonas locisalis TaxID=3133978 RepID=UPI0031015B2C
MKAPIVLFVYNRPSHTRKVIKALQRCKGAQDSELYIFSDAAQNQEEEIKVNDLRSYLDTITGFKEVHIIKRACNCGLAYNIINGVSEVINKYQKAIVLEDDIICAPQFLWYMNEALEKYKNDKDIFSISGYHPYVDCSNQYNIAVYKNYRSSSWGWATWADRWNKVDWEVKGHKKFFGSIPQRRAFDKGGEDLSLMLWKQIHGLLDSWAIRFCYAQYKHNAYTIYPVKSLVSNIGFDGSGRHSGAGSRFSVKLNKEGTKFNLPDHPEVNQHLIKEFRKYYRLPFKKKVKKVLLMDILNGWNR